MLADTFPGFLDQPKAKVKGQKIRYWTSLENRRKHLLAFAAEMGFDPMVLANWRGKTAKMTANQVNNPILSFFTKLKPSGVAFYTDMEAR